MDLGARGMVAANFNLASIRLDDLPDNAESKADSCTVRIFLGERLKSLVGEERRAHAAPRVSNGQRNRAGRACSSGHICCMQRNGDVTCLRIFDGVAEKTANPLVSTPSIVVMGNFTSSQSSSKSLQGSSISSPARVKRLKRYSKFCAST